MAKKLFIKDAIFNYVHIKAPSLEYEKKVDPSNDFMNKEYVLDVLMPFADWKVLKKLYKNVKSIASSRDYSPEEYEKAFKIAPPTDKKYKNSDGEFTLVKFRQRAYYKNTGDPTVQPGVVGTVEVKRGNVVIGTKDDEGNAVGADIEVGNGSRGNVQFRERPWSYGGKPGVTLDLVGIQVINLVEYTPPNELGFDMSEEEAGDDDGNPFSDGTEDSEADQAGAPSGDDSDPEWDNK